MDIAFNTHTLLNQGVVYLFKDHIINHDSKIYNKFCKNTIEDTTENWTLE